jgi:hypothetical protein
VNGILQTSSCNAVAGTATTEVCDGSDNDCDGQIDEEIVAIVSDCSAGIGICQEQGSITTSCINGVMTTNSCTAFP